MTNILKKIIKNKITWLQERKKRQPLHTFQQKIVKSNYNFKKSLKSIHPSFILEIKKASPSLGIINNTFNLKSIASIYKKYASAISVLTDEQYFHGNFEFIPQVREIAFNQPILCKDFFIDPYQIYLARYYKADAILLMLSILNDNQYIFLRNIAKSLNMGVLTEIENKKELNRALNLKSEIIGINNRNLHDFSIDINKTKLLASLIPNTITVISESGIRKYAHIRKLKPLVQGFLIGSYLMQQKDLKTAILRIIIGNNKICGLTRPFDAQILKKYGIIYGGLIFCKLSPRYIDDKRALSITSNTILKYIGIFCNENIKKILNITMTLSLYAIQLHGNEDQTYINNLRNQLPDNIKIWKGMSYLDFIKKNKSPLYNVDKYVIDNKNGGSGKSFNWTYLKNYKLNHVILAGGLNTKNCISATNLNCFGFDFNSGLENKPGIKSVKKITMLVHSLRTHTIINCNSI